jgi:hypothetical protein
VRHGSGLERFMIDVICRNRLRSAGRTAKSSKNGNLLESGGTLNRSGFEDILVKNFIHLRDSMTFLVLLLCSLVRSSP